MRIRTPSPAQPWRREFEQEFAKVRSNSGELSKNAYFAREARKIRRAAAFLSSAITIVMRMTESGLVNGLCFSVTAQKKSRQAIALLVLRTGDGWIEAETTKDALHLLSK